MTPPISIDGTDITGATIDGTDVQEITVDGQTVFSAGPTIIENFEDGIGAWSRAQGDASFSQTSFASEGSFALEVNENSSNSSITRPLNQTFTGTIELQFDFAEDGPGDFGFFGFSDVTGGNVFVVFDLQVDVDGGQVYIRTGDNDINFSNIPNNQYVPFAITLDFANQEITQASVNGQTVTQTEPFKGTGTPAFLKLFVGNGGADYYWDNIRFTQL